MQHALHNSVVVKFISASLKHRVGFRRILFKPSLWVGIRTIVYHESNQDTASPTLAEKKAL
jgi:hypothetical protein